MALNLSNLGAPKGANSNKKRVGRGMGSGHGQDVDARPQGPAFALGFAHDARL